MNKSIRRNNRGASLVAVVIALVFVGTIGVIIASITATNIQMREVERASKINFYTTENAMNEVNIGLNNIASNAMQQAYTDILESYAQTNVPSDELQNMFNQEYMTLLMNEFQMNDMSYGASYTQKQYSSTPEGKYIFVAGYYDVNKIKGCLSTQDFIDKDCVKIEVADAKYTADFESGLLTLKNITVIYTNAQNYESKITTDVVFHTPSLTMDSNSAVQEYVDFAIIADTAIEMGASNAKIDGKTYAGVGGIYTTTNANNCSIMGSHIITRGDIHTESGTSLTVGSAGTEIWAENVGTEGIGSPSTLNLNGNIFVADDLTLNGIGSQVNLTGNYYGYNYAKTYDSADMNKDAAYSSAVILNAKNSQVDMTNLNFLYLAGRTFVSRGSAGNTQNTDIMSGESVSVRTNQLAYYVDDSYLAITYNVNGTVNTVDFAPGKDATYSAKVGVSNIRDYLSTAKPITPYYYIDNGMAKCRFYLNLKDEQAANDFFKACYVSSTGLSIISNALGYVGADAIKVDDHMLYTLAGDFMFTDNASDSLAVEGVTIGGGTGTSVDAAFRTVSLEYAKTYKSYQISLSDATEIGPADVRFLNAAGEVDKTINPMFNYLIDETEFKNSCAGFPNKTIAGVTPLDAAHNRVSVMIDNEGDSAYSIPLNYTEGVIVATGDVYVSHDFNGLICCKGTVRFAANAKVSSNDAVISDMFAEDHALGASGTFSRFFKTNSTSQYGVLGLVTVEDYITYDNWTKNEE